MAILAHSICISPLHSIFILPLLCLPFTRLKIGDFPGFKAENDLHFGDIIILILMQFDVAVHGDRATLPWVACDPSLSARVVCLVLNQY